MRFPFIPDFSALPQVRFIRRRFAVLTAREVLLEHWLHLLTPFHHSHLVNSRRAAMVVNRVQFLAFLCAFLVLVWSVVDFWFVPRSLWLYLFGLRLLTCVAFLALAMLYRPEGRLLDAYQALGIWCMIPVAFYLASWVALSSFRTESFHFLTGYGFLPFMLLSSLMLFPLTLLECIAFSLPILVAQAVLGFVEWRYAQHLAGNTLPGDLWLLCVLTLFSMFASLCQLTLMLALVNQGARDPLTRIFTRHSGEELLHLQFHLAQRTQAPLALAFIDLDHFKTINDQYGHESGDMALKNAAAAITRKLRTGDVLVRWGGEEFLLVMPNTTLSQARIAMKRIGEQGLGQRPDGMPLTASIGVAESLKDGATNEQHLVEIADRRMYQAKRRGRNRIITQD